MKLTQAELKRVQKYRPLLPKTEVDALAAWLTTFWPFQRPWILDFSRNAFCNKSRQIGISHATAAILVLWAAFHGETTTVISIGEREAKEVLDKCKKHRNVLVRLGSKMALPSRIDSTTEMHFASGGRIIALPATAGRSFTGNVYLDEFAYYTHPEQVWDAAMAVTMLGFRTRVSSTPNGVGNEFHALVTDPVVGKGWSPHTIPLQVALDCGYPVDLDHCWTIAKGDPRLFSQLFQCGFLDGELQYLPSELIEPCRVGRSQLEGDGGVYVAGLDVGRTSDRTVLIVMRKQRGVSRVVYIQKHRRTDSKGLHKMVDDAFEKFGLSRLCVDSTGLGSFPAEEMQNRHGFYKVTPVDFTLDSKETLATGLHSAFNAKSLLVPRRDDDLPEPPEGLKRPEVDTAKQLFLDLCAIQRIITTAGNVRYDAPQTSAGHADSAWALALAQMAANEVVEYQDVGSLGAML